MEIFASENTCYLFIQSLIQTFANWFKLCSVLQVTQGPWKGHTQN